MATELSNYANDYRLRYRTFPTTAGNLTTGNVSRVGIETQAADYNVMPLPDEDEYGMYADGTGTAADPYENFDPQPFPLTGASFAGQVAFPRNDGLGAIQGRYSLTFVNGATDGGTAGFETGATNPASGTNVGDAFYNTTQDKLYVWNGSSWVDQA